jgi:small subunit ribosomal protein S6
MPFYEHTFIARPDLSSQQVQGLTDRFANIIQENGGSVTKVEHWGLRNLTYRIKKSRKGHYVHFNVDGPPAAIAELERNQRLTEDIIRYLTVRTEALEAGPSAMMQSRSSRDERERPRREEREHERPRREFAERREREEVQTIVEEE